MKILAIETSCDETAAALVYDGKKIISSLVSSSIAIQKKWGGIVPEKAAREQIKYIVPIIEGALQKAKINEREIDTIAVTEGPGLIGSLLVGIETAKTLALVWNKPIIPVNHLLGHMYASFLMPDSKKIALPAMSLIVSGGHTLLILFKNHGNFKKVGETKDDAAGECLDKCSRLLGLGYPGGPAIEKEAYKFKGKTTFKLPRPMINENNFDFSFSGLKTAVLYLINKIKDGPDFYFKKKQIAFEIQEAVTDVLVQKTISAARHFNVKSVIIGGGVTANSRLREKFKKAGLKEGFRIFIPSKDLSTDNAATIAAAAFYNYKECPLEEIKPKPSLTII